MLTFASRQARGRAVVRVLAAVIAGSTVIVCSIAASGARAQLAFYEVARGELVGRPGTLIRREPLQGAPAGASAYRVLYRSTGIEGNPIAVSGIVVVPAGPSPADGRPIVAWAHPTSGVAPRCAPSLAIFVFQFIQGLREMVERGYVVVATDYPGLGAPGTHPFLVGISEGRAVLDSVRAAQEVPGVGAAHRFTVWGHSQGGHAALYTGILVGRYAPDLLLLGVAAAAPATELATLLDDDISTAGGKSLTALTLWSWDRVFGASMQRVVQPDAMASINQLAGECLESAYDLIARHQSERPLERSFLKVPNLANVEPWRSLAARNTPGVLPRNVPIFLSQGGKDSVVSPPVTHDYMQRLCAAGSAVRMLVMPGVNHDFLGRDSAGAAIDWMADRFAGRPIPNDCGAH